MLYFVWVLDTFLEFESGKSIPSQFEAQVVQSTQLRGIDFIDIMETIILRTSTE